LYLFVFLQFPDLDLGLLSGVLQGLEDVPGVPPLHLHAGHILPVPVLDQHRGLYSFRRQRTDTWSHGHHVSMHPWT